MIREDDLQLNGLRILQDTERFCFGSDAVILSDFVRLEKGGRLLDMGCGNGVLPLLLSAKTEASELVGLEIQKESAALAERNVELNGLKDRIRIVCGDLREAGELFGRESFSAICCNPPYIADGAGLLSESSPKALARHELLCRFEDVARESEKLLPHGGSLFLVHRPERLAELIVTLRKYRMEVKRLRFAHPGTEHAAVLVLIEALKGGRPGMKTEAPLLLEA